MGIAKQIVFIEGQKYSGKKTLERYEVELKKLPDFIVEQDISDIYLFGNENFTKKIEKETRELELNLYAKDTKKFHYNT